MFIKNEIFPQEYENKYLDYFSAWEFTLSNFQKWAIAGIIEEKNILITAHTGSGKTLPAEFAIKYFVSQGKKVIYTTPIKALSNEKFNDLQQKYPDISFGILTGDIKYNPEADVLIMTTEILYNTLFQKIMIEKNNETKQNITLDFDIDIQRELSAVVFDEIHYINDADRGRIWEETIMTLPKHVQIIGLSATIDQPEHFCQWIENVSSRETWLCSNKSRVVPLTHFAFLTYPESSYDKFSQEIKNKIEEHKLNEPIILKKQNNMFHTKKYDATRKVLKTFYKEKVYINNYFVMNKMVEYLKRHGILPSLCFVFSRKMTRVYAEKITVPLFEENSKIPSIIKKECQHILMKLPNYREYTSLPEYHWITKLLEKGIAVHHSGITPVFREMIEILFGKGYIKLLFATETFAVGINMPTKAVIFSSLTKFDGNKFRNLYSHEYAQMAGRAGRRGKDTRGYVFHLVNLFRENQIPNAGEMTKILSGKPEMLKSKFKINFNSILKLISGENFNLCEFAETSMMNKLIKAEKQETKKELEKNVLELKGFSFSNFSIEEGVLKEYNEMSQKAPYIRGKNKKKLERKMAQISTAYKNFDEEFSRYQGWLKKLDQTKKIEQRLANIDSYISSEIAVHLDILEKNNFIEIIDEHTYKITEMGKISLHIHEIHSLSISNFILNNDIQYLTTKELVMVLSVFCDIRLSDENKIVNVSYATENKNVVGAIKEIKKYYNKYYDIETSAQTAFLFNYEIQYDLVEIMEKWFNAETAEQSILVLQEAEKWGIEIGNFTKAVMKICNISRELEKSFQTIEKLEICQKLREIPDKVMKFIITNQSLYI